MLFKDFEETKWNISIWTFEWPGAILENYFGRRSPMFESEYCQCSLGAQEAVSPDLLVSRCTALVKSIKYISSIFKVS